MTLLEDHTASFIVRIWREGGEVPNATPEWRGSIEHVSSGQRAFFRDLGAITKFMTTHLNDLGIDTAARFWELMSDDSPPEPDLPSPPPLPNDPRRRATSRG